MGLSGSILAGVPLVRISGELDHSSREQLRCALRQALRKPNPYHALLFDLCECRFIDGAALSTFACGVEALPASGWMGLIGSSPGISRLVDVCGLKQSGRLFLFESRRQARSFIRRQRPTRPHRQHPLAA